MASVNAPTLLFPNGGENLSTPTIAISWQPPAVPATNGGPVWFELFYSAAYVAEEKTDWIAIASVPSSVSEFLWRVGRDISSNSVRVGIRSCNSQGVRTPMTVSANNFSINLRTTLAPRIISPVQNGRYDSTIQIVVAADSMPDRSYYQFYYSSLSAGIPVTSIAQQVLARDLPLAWTVVQLPAANDYVVYAGIVNSDGSTSALVSVENINITHEGYFIIDTLPPQASIKLSGGNLFTNNPNVSASVYAFDVATGIQSMQIGSDTPQQAKVNVTATLLPPDGVKEVTALVQDFGGNRNNDAIVLPILINALPLLNANIVDFYVSVFSGVIYIHSVSVGTDSSTQNGLYETVISDGVIGFGRQLQPITDTPTAVVSFNGDNYVATIDPDGIAHLLQEVVTGMSTAFSLPQGEQIMDLEVFDDLMYLGTNTGVLYSYDGSILRSISSGSDEVAENGSFGTQSLQLPPITKLKTDGGRMYVLFENSETVGVFTGSTLFLR